MTERSLEWGLESPNPFGSMEILERHLKDLKALPDDSLTKNDEIADVERTIAAKRRQAAG